jgi:sugar phosphate isomerase/epimerase
LPGPNKENEPVAKKMTKGAPTAEKLGWRLGMQAFTFHKYTFFEAVDKVAKLGLKYIEAYPGQALSKKKPDVKFNHEADPAVWKEAKAKLKAAGVKVVCYGVVRLRKDEAACRVVFDFAKTMGIETIVTEPTRQACKLLDKLSKEYGITLSIHNHPRPSRYWGPQHVLTATKGCSRRIGACADNGHWMRSGVDPMKATKALKGRIVSLHLKDLTEFGVREAHDVPWGTGVGDVRALLEELYRQKVKAVFSIEYEHNWFKSMPEIAKCINYFESVAKELAKK